MAIALPRPDRARIEAQVLAITRDLLRELGYPAGDSMLKVSASLDEDLGLGSIERVELAVRLERALGVTIPESVASDARTLGDIVEGIARQRADEGGNQVEQNSVDGSGGEDWGAERRQETSWDSGVTDTDAPAMAAPSTPRWSAVESTRGDRRLLWRLWEKIYGIYAAGVFLLWVVPTWLILHVLPRGEPGARMTSSALRLYFWLIGCRLRLEGRENLDASGAYAYVSNHTSYSDVPVVMALFHTNYHFVAKSEINQMPFVGSFLRRLGHFSFERGKLRARSRQAEQMEQTLLRGESLYIFAEGTFSAQPGVRPFHLGAFRAAVKTGRPIIPVALKGARQFLPDGAWLPRPSRITVTVCPALVPKPSTHGREWAEVLRLRDECRKIISSRSGEPLL